MEEYTEGEWLQIYNRRDELVGAEGMSFEDALIQALQEFEEGFLEYWNV